MFGSFRRKTAPPGLPPGTLVHVGEQKIETPKITVLDYDEGSFRLKESATVDECRGFRDQPTTTWINVAGLHDVEILRELGECYGIHPLVLEDILDTQQRPKFDDLGAYLFVEMNMLRYDPQQEEPVAEQLSVVLGPNVVLSFQESDQDVFNPIRERLDKGLGRLRKGGADYLAYSLIDAVVDNYFVVLEKVGERIEDLEDELIVQPTPETLQRMHQLKRQLLLLRSSVWPLREVISALTRGDSGIIKQETVIYLRDVYDHTIQVMDTLETYRDMVSGMIDIYLSSISNKLNEVMKVLTIIATIFMPLTFLAGLYGMNFHYMPELGKTWGYPAVLVVMGTVALGMVMYFRRKRWL